VAVEKLRLPELCKNLAASGRPKNDFLDFWIHSGSPVLYLIFFGIEFSTPTGVSAQNQECEWSREQAQ
jgi:hypothetical protein